MGVEEFGTKSDVEVMHNRMKSFDSSYDPSLRSMSQLSKMPNIARFLNCPNHCRRTPFSIEMRLCGVEDCDLCEMVGRSIRTPDVVVNGRNLREETLRYTTLPVINKDDDKHHLPPAEAREYQEEKNLTVGELTAIIPSARLDTEEKQALAEAKRKDKEFTFSATKVRATASCTCGAVRCIYSNNMVGLPGGPSEAQFEDLQRMLENEGYTCGNRIKGCGKKFYSRRAIRCGDPIESYYYNPNTGTKGGRIVTKNICAVCYVDDDLIAPNQIKQLRDVGGKTPLMMCKACVDSGIDVPCSNARKNVKQAKQQKKASKRKKMSKAVKSGRRKARRG